MRWLDVRSPAVRAAVVSGAYGKIPHSPHFAAPPTGPDEIDVLADCLERASSVLEGVTAGVFHPPLQVVEDYVCGPRTTRLSPSLGPLRSVAALWSVSSSGVLEAELRDYVLHGGDVRFTLQDHVEMPWLGDTADLSLERLWRVRFACACLPSQRLRLVYNVGSTIDAQARAMVLALAHEFYLQVAPCDECGTCRLPLRTTSVQREGISFTVADPLEAGTTTGSTGLPEVDLWVAQVNPYRVGRPPRVFDPSAPPPVVRNVLAATPTWPTVPTGQVSAVSAVTAQGSVT
jgi:hypothetical protein